MDEPRQAMNVAGGIDASRRVAWARYYEMEAQRDKLLRLNSALEERLAELAMMIAENESLIVIEPDGELICRARSIIAALRLRPRGLAALNKVREQRRTA